MKTFVYNFISQLLLGNLYLSLFIIDYSLACQKTLLIVLQLLSDLQILQACDSYCFWNTSLIRLLTESGTSNRFLNTPCLPILTSITYDLIVFYSFFFCKVVYVLVELNLLSFILLNKGNNTIKISVKSW